MVMELKGKRVGIIGLGKRTGVVSAKVLTGIVAKVVLSDVKPAEKLHEELSMLAGIDGITYDLGGHTEKVLDVDLVVASPGVPLEIPIFEEARRRGIEVISEIELAFRLSKAKYIAITGTNGKSTTTTLTGELFRTYPHRVFVGGNIGRPLIGEALNLGAEDLVVAEVSSFQLETIDTFHPHIALFLNITPDHLDRHKTMENYLEAKMRIFKNQTEEDYLILNADDPTLTDIVAKRAPSQKVWFSRKAKRLPGMYLDGNRLMAALEGEPQELLTMEELKIRGYHNIENALAASAAAILGGISLADIRTAMRNFRGLEHTLEFVVEKNGVQYYNDSKGTNPDASIKALEAFHEPVVLIAGGLSRGLDFTDFAKKIVEKVKALVLLGETREELRNMALEAGFSGPIEVVQDLCAAVERANGCAQPGDVVLLSPACASWDMFESYSERGRLFREYVKG